MAHVGLVARKPDFLAKEQKKAQASLHIHAV